MFSFACPVWAGHYERHYSGGSVTFFSYDGTPFTFPYQEYGDGSYGNGYGNCAWGSIRQPDGSLVAASGNIEYQGQITATFTWVRDPGINDDDPPQNVLITEEASAMWGGGGDWGAAGTGNASDGLGDTPIIHTSDPGDDHWVGNGRSVGIHYKIESGATFTVHCSPSVTLSGTGVVGPPSEGGGGTGNVSFRADASPIEISLNGYTRIGGSKHVLMGQQITATIGGATFDPDSYRWNGTGNFVKGFGVQQSNFSGDPEQGGVTPYEASDWWQPSFDLYYKDNLTSPATIRCGATVVTPDGNFSVTAMTKVIVDKPTYSFVVSNFGQVKLKGTGEGTVVGLLPEFPESFTSSGINWTYKVKTPDEYLFYGYGSCALVQIVSVSRQRYDDQNNLIQNWEVADILDGGYPKPNYTLGNDSTPPANDVEIVDGDSPQQSLGGCRHCTIWDSFHTFLMYLPPTLPNRSSIYVPLDCCIWQWSATVDRTDPIGSSDYNYSLTQHSAECWILGAFPAFPSWTSWYPPHEDIH